MGVLGLLFASGLWACGAPREIFDPFVVIAHAGGTARGRTYSNSLEALDQSAAKGFTLVELDFSWTSDGHLVLLHDWDQEFTRLFDGQPGRRTLAEFKSLTSRFGLTQMDLADLGSWMDQNPDVWVITDIKQRNLEGLRHIADRLPGHRQRIVPQIYEPTEYAPVRGLGFDRIILTIYASELSDDALCAFASDHHLAAVTMPLGRAVQSELGPRLAEIGVRVLVHPVNDRGVAADLRNAGIDGVYTDWLSPTVFQAPVAEEPVR